MEQSNYYEVLGLTQSCSAKDIKKSYHQLALAWHPDKHIDKKEAEINFAFINEAYTTLSDTKKRAIYDACGKNGVDLHENSKSSEGQSNMDKIFDKGFCGTNKSAFDILKDICEGNDDDYFFKNGNIAEACPIFETNVKSFLHQNVLFSADEQGDFFEEYKPTFMTVDFTSGFSTLETFFAQNTNYSQLFGSCSNNEEPQEKGENKMKNGLSSVIHKKKITLDVQDLLNGNYGVFFGTDEEDFTEIRTKVSYRKGSFLIKDDDHDDDNSSRTRNFRESKLNDGSKKISKQKKQEVRPEIVTKLKKKISCVN